MVVFVSWLLWVHFIGGYFGEENVPEAKAVVSGPSESTESTILTQQEQEQQRQQRQEKREQEQKQRQEQKQNFLEQQQEQLQAIEEQAAQKRQRIEEDYLQKCMALQTWITEATKSLDPYEKMAWAELTQKLKHTISVTSQKGTTTTCLNPYGYRNYVVSSGSSTETKETYVTGNPAQEYANKQWEIVKARNDMLRDYKQEFARLGRQRQYKLSEVDKWEQSKKNYIVNSTQVKVAKLKSTGLVTSIMYSEDKSSIVLGNRIMMHEGDIIHGIVVEKIYRDKVEFIKNKKRWTQKIRETPSPEWYQ